MVFVDVEMATTTTAAAAAAGVSASATFGGHVRSGVAASFLLPLAYCPAENAGWAAYHDRYPIDARWALGGWMPYIARNPAFWAWTAFYVALGVAMRECAAACLRRLATLLYRDEIRALDARRRRQRLTDWSIDTSRARVAGAYTASFVHALTCAVLAVAVLARSHFFWISFSSAGAAADDRVGYVTYHAVLTHSFGYMLADLAVDRDPVYVPHHVASLVFGELALRLGASFYMATWFALACELGNVRTHAEALRRLTCTDAAYRHAIALPLYVSRAVSFVPALLSAACDGADPYRVQFAVGVLACMLCVYGSNLASLSVASDAARVAATTRAPATEAVVVAPVVARVAPVVERLAPTQVRERVGRRRRPLDPGLDRAAEDVEALEAVAAAGY